MKIRGKSPGLSTWAKSRIRIGCFWTHLKCPNLGEWPENNLRGITLEIRAVWVIHSLILHSLLVVWYYTFLCSHDFFLILKIAFMVSVLGTGKPTCLKQQVRFLTQERNQRSASLWLQQTHLSVNTVSKKKHWVTDAIWWQRNLRQKLQDICLLLTFKLVPGYFTSDFELTTPG